MDYNARYLHRFSDIIKGVRMEKTTYKKDTILKMVKKDLVELNHEQLINKYNEVHSYMMLILESIAFKDNK